MHAAYIPPRYAGCSLTNFQVAGTEATQRETLLRALSDSQRYVDGFVTDTGRFRESGLLYMGPPGVGKTHLAVAVLRELIERYRVRGLFVDFTALIHKIQSTFDPRSPASKQDILDPVTNAELLVLDELAAQKPSPWVSEILYLVLNSRYTERRPTLFTTNYRLSEDSPEQESLDRPQRAGGEGVLDTRLPAMLLSRLYEMAQPVLLEVEDFRRRVKMLQNRV